MTDQKVQQTVTQAIAETSIEPWKYYHVCWWEGRLQCLHVHHTKEHHPIFYGASGYVFANGLTVHQWRLLTERVMDFCESRGITLTTGPSRHKRKKPGEPFPERPKITDFDSIRLRALLASARAPGSPANADLDKLQRLLETSDTVDPRDMPKDVVTMNSQVRLKDDQEDNEMTLSLVFPADALRDADFDKMKVSILTPIGLSILGRRVGDTIEGRIRVHELLYQPEAAGDFHL